MTYREFQLKIFNLSDKDLRDIAQEIVKTYSSVAVDVQNKIDHLYADLIDVKPKDYLHYANTKLKLRTLLDDITRNLASSMEIIATQTIAISKRAISTGYFGKAFVLSFDSGFVASALPDTFINAAVAGQVGSWEGIRERFGDRQNYTPKAGTLSSTLYRNKIQATKKIRAIVNRNLLVGNSVDVMRKDIDKFFIGKNKEKALSQGQAYKSMRIARTETLRALNAGNYAATYEATSQGIELKKIWITIVDKNTRQSHLILDGMSLAIEEPFFIGEDSALYPLGFSEAKNVIFCRCKTVETLRNVSMLKRSGKNPVTGKYTPYSFEEFEAYKRQFIAA